MAYLSQYQYYENAGAAPTNKKLGVLSVCKLGRHSKQFSVDVFWKSFFS